jgi:membrane fusion protein, macrolide-specific efflux system
MPSKVVRRVLSLVAMLCLTGCYLFPKEEKVLAPPLLANPEVTYETYEVKKGTIESKTVVSGSFISVSETPLYFTVSGNRLKQIAVKIGDDVKVGALVAELDTGSLESRIAEQKIVLRKAQVVSERAVVMGRDRFEKELASLDVDLATLQLNDLQESRNEARLIAPVAGRVVYVGSMRPGDLVDGFRTVVQIDDPINLQVFYKGADTGVFAIGVEVAMNLEDGRKFSGKVVQGSNSSPADTPDNLRGAIIVKPTALPAKVQIGDNVTLTRLTAHRENVIVLPRDLVHTYLGRDFVEVMENGEKKEKTVELGVQTPTDVEVVKGLAVGEKILSQ